MLYDAGKLVSDTADADLQWPWFVAFGLVDPEEITSESMGDIMALRGVVLV